MPTSWRFAHRLHYFIITVFAIKGVEILIHFLTKH